MLALGLVSAGLLAVTAAPAAAQDSATHQADRATREVLCAGGLDTTTDAYLTSAAYLTCLGDDRGAREAVCAGGLDTTTDAYLTSAAYLACLGRLAGGGVLSPSAYTSYPWENLGPNNPVHFRHDSNGKGLTRGTSTSAHGAAFEGAVSTYVYDDEGRGHVCTTWPSGWSDCP
ncbi:hypothetical protein [Candidatus Poriferisodalis sp.]|uniref:hypothetical protein n=1 Tax=Candidatus Poriferisodalis sp. TaxID=3101277 RepID=UPI003B0221B4